MKALINRKSRAMEFPQRTRFLKVICCGEVLNAHLRTEHHYLQQVMICENR